MRVVLWLVCALALCCTVLGGDDKTDDEVDPYKVKFDIEVVEKPEECERKSADGDKLTVHYTGKLHKTGEKFDSSLDRDEPFSFTLGLADVIPGWAMGLGDMCIGEKRRLIIPPLYGYKDKSAGKIPPNSVLEFDVELLDITEGDTPEKLFKQMDLDHDGRVGKEEIRAWLMKGAELHATPEEKNQIKADPSLLDAGINAALKEDDKNRDGYLEWEEVREKWSEQLTTHEEL